MDSLLQAPLRPAVSIDERSVAQRKLEGMDFEVPHHWIRAHRMGSVLVATDVRDKIPFGNNAESILSAARYIPFEIPIVSLAKPELPVQFESLSIFCGRRKI